ncbi:hypothetical protein Pla52nx_005452 [Stieleria varia]|uniref:Knr4/Smi1-like domain-containing protein n=1 Tax=Stieleria varia TaxID=2528005 RepID=A0A5C6AXP9_9BACT|nr:hypothetical protein Pla52n_24480 [Stieleria varia]
MSKKTVPELIEILVSLWATPRVPQYMVDARASLEMPMQCTSKPVIESPEIAGFPPDLASFWLHFESVCLFQDVNYGQWGLKLLSQPDSRSVTSRSFSEFLECYSDVEGQKFWEPQFGS